MDPKKSKNIGFASRDILQPKIATGRHGAWDGKLFFGGARGKETVIQKKRSWFLLARERITEEKASLEG